MNIPLQSSEQAQLAILNHLHVLYAVILGGVKGWNYELYISLDVFATL